MRQRILFIINPKSGIHNKHDIPKLIQTYLDDTKFDAEIIYTQYSGHGYKLAKEAIEQGVDIICAVGGDGSVHNIGMALIGRECKLGIIPVGSGNGYARHFDIPTQVKFAILTLNQLKVRKIDVGVINRKFFLGVTGFGFDGHVAAKFAKKKSRGFWGYVRLIFKEYFKYNEKTYTIEFGNGSKIQQKAFMVSVSNASEFGNGFCISPYSDVQDGKLELVVLRKPPLYKAPFIVSQFFKGTAQNSKYVTSYRFTELILHTDSTKFHADGEPISLKMPVQINAQTQAINLIVGENFA